VYRRKRILYERDSNPKKENATPAWVIGDGRKSKREIVYTWNYRTVYGGGKDTEKTTDGPTAYRNTTPREPNKRPRRVPSIRAALNHSSNGFVRRHNNNVILYKYRVVCVGGGGSDRGALESALHPGRTTRPWATGGKKRSPDSGIPPQTRFLPQRYAHAHDGGPCPCNDRLMVVVPQRSSSKHCIITIIMVIIIIIVAIMIIVLQKQ